MKSSEELKIPVLENASKGLTGNPCIDCIAKPCAIGFGLFCLFFFVIPIIAQQWNFTTDKPDIRLDSLFYCPTSDKLVIFDLNFNIKNPNNHTYLCIYPFEVSIFFSNSYNQNYLLTKSAPLSTTCVLGANQTSATVLADAFLLLLDPDRTNQTISFDLKIHAHLSFTLHPYRADYGVELVCKDAKVDLSTSQYNSSSSCASMVGPPFTCSYVYTKSIVAAADVPPFIKKKFLVESYDI